MKKRTRVFGWTKQFQRIEQLIKSSTKHLNILNPKHGEEIKRHAVFVRNLVNLHKERVKRLRGGV